MRTSTSKQAESITFEKFGTASLIIGPNKVLFQRHVIKPLRAFYEAHTESCNMAFCLVLGFGFGVIVGIFG